MCPKGHRHSLLSLKITLTGEAICDNISLSDRTLSERTLSDRTTRRFVTLLVTCKRGTSKWINGIESIMPENCFRVQQTAQILRYSVYQ